ATTNSWQSRLMNGATISAPPNITGMWPFAIGPWNTCICTSTWPSRNWTLRKQTPTSLEARSAKDATMISIIDWIVPALVGDVFTLVGSVKLYGLSRGIVGGADKPFTTRLCGT